MAAKERGNNMADRIFLSNKEYEELSVENRKRYYSKLREYCSKLDKTWRRDLASSIVGKVFLPKRIFFYDVEDTRSMPNGNVLFVSNHTSMRDYFVIREVLQNEFGINPSSLIASDNLGNVAKSVYSSCGAILADRTDAGSYENSKARLVSNLMCGNCGFMYGECILNLHPYKLLQPVLTDAVHMAIAARVPIVPVIIEYRETSEIVEYEEDLYDSCTVRFCEPIKFDETMDFDIFTAKLMTVLKSERASILARYGNVRSELNDVNAKIYLNHTYLKKYGIRGFSLNTSREKAILYKMLKLQLDNEYTCDAYGRLIPGVITKEKGKRFVILPK